MATAAAKTTTTRRRPTAKPAAKTAPPAAEDAVVVEKPATGKAVISLEHDRDTANFAVFTWPEDAAGCVGNVYVPLGTASVKVQLEVAE